VDVGDLVKCSHGYGEIVEIVDPDEGHFDYEWYETAPKVGEAVVFVWIGGRTVKVELDEIRLLPSLAQIALQANEG
jgi:hypothetical protein